MDQFSLFGPVRNDPAPDILDISPDGKYIFMSMRGPNPLTGNNPAFNIARRPISRIVGGVERADPHGLRVLVK